MRRTILLSIIIALTTFSAFSQSKQESIKLLIHLMKTDSLVEKIFTSVVPVIMKQTLNNGQDSVQITSRVQNMNAVLASSKLLFNKILDEDIVEIYDKFYTENEIKDLIVFYSSPTGKKTIEKTPEMQKEIMSIVMQKYMLEKKKNI